jgi:hypothetical protein
MPQTADVRRNACGAIDIDGYRVAAAALRRQAMRDRASLGKGFASVLATAAVLGLVGMFGAMLHSDVDHVAGAAKGASIASAQAAERLGAPSTIPASGANDPARASFARPALASISAPDPLATSHMRRGRARMQESEATQ